jgi:hypothetical protein
MHRMRVLSRRLKSWAFFFSMVAAIPLVFAVLTTITDGITEHSLLLAAAALLCLFAAGVLWLVYGFAWAMVPEEAPREKEVRPPLVSLSEEKEDRSPLLSPPVEREDRSPILSLHIEKENRPPLPSPPVEKEDRSPLLSLHLEKENRPPLPSPPLEKEEKEIRPSPPSPPAEEKKEKKKKEKEEEPIYTITGRRIN